MEPFNSFKRGDVTEKSNNNKKKSIHFFIKIEIGF